MKYQEMRYFALPPSSRPSWYDAPPMEFPGNGTSGTFCQTSGNAVTR